MRDVSSRSSPTPSESARSIAALESGFGFRG